MTRNKTLSAASAEVVLSQRDLDTLVRVADLYMTIKPLRLIVRYAAPRDIRARFRFVADESKWLKRLAREIRAGMRSEGLNEREVTFTLPALVGFWGRLLASVNAPRTRRRLSKSEFRIRQELISRFQGALTVLASRNRRQVEDQIQTRRPVEEVWMRERLGLPQRHQEVEAPNGTMN